MPPYAPILVAVVLHILVPSAVSANIPAAATCLSSAKDLEIANATIEAKQRLERYERIGGVSRSVKSFADKIFSAGVSDQVNKEIALISNVAISHVEWTREKGSLVEIILIRDDLNEHPAYSPRGNFLGGGNCPYDVLVSAVGRETPAIRPGGTHIDNDASFYIWFSRSDSGKITSSVVYPGSRGLLYEKAFEDKANRDFLNESLKERDFRRLRGLVQSIEAESKSLAVKAQVRQAMDKLEDAQKNQSEIERDLKDALEEQRRIAGAAAWISQLEKVLTIAQLAVQVNAMMSPSTPTQVKNDLASAPTSDQMKTVLSDYNRTQTAIVTTRTNDKTVIEQLTTTYRKTILDGATQSGAPSTIYTPP